MITALLVSTALAVGVPTVTSDSPTDINVNISYDQQSETTKVDYTTRWHKDSTLQPSWVIVEQFRTPDTVPATRADVIETAEFIETTIGSSTGVLSFAVLDSQPVGTPLEEILVPLAEITADTEIDLLFMLPRIETWEQDVMSVRELTSNEWFTTDPHLDQFLATQDCTNTFDDMITSIPYSNTAVSTETASTVDYCEVRQQFSIVERDLYMLTALTYGRTAELFDDGENVGITLSPAMQDRQDVTTSIEVNGEKQTVDVEDELQVTAPIPTTTVPAPQPAGPEAGETPAGTLNENASNGAASSSNTVPLTAVLVVAAGAISAVGVAFVRKQRR